MGMGSECPVGVGVRSPGMSWARGPWIGVRVSAVSVGVHGIGIQIRYLQGALVLYFYVCKESMRPGIQATIMNRRPGMHGASS